MSEQQKEHPHYPVTELELYQIRNDCKYPDRKDCNGCEGENSDCCFSTNHLIDEILTRSASSPHPAPAFTPHIPGKEQSNTYRCCEVCPNVLTKPVFRVNCMQPQHDAAKARKAREDALIAFGKEVCDRFHLKPRPYDPNDCEIPQIGLDELAEIMDATRESLRTEAHK